MLVGGDFGVADRLVEAERKNFPKEGPQESITRAVVKLLRGRQ